MSAGTPYSRERLAEAARRCGDIDEVIVFLGTRPYANLRRHLLARFARFGIDVSHFRPCGRRPRPTREELCTAVAESSSLADVLRRLERTVNGTQRARLRAWLAEEGIDAAHFPGQAHQRGRPARNAKPPQEVLVLHDGARRTATSRLRRALLAVGVPERCARCGVGPEWLGKPMTLEVDHISGAWRDDRRENLRLLCPNCHALTGTWCRGGAGRPVSAGTMTGT
ncbi:HNH endonuclease signature motif containing protein [Streptomyces sp. NPDC046859]|uniref:HNH endonuclease n=1 Tax=Streptomyces sp. NPDC046859 TaxID=3155734 RepID=UPI0034033693